MSAASATDRDLRPFQAEGKAFLRQAGRALLADDPGLGKSRQALEAATEPLLVIGPASLEGTWDDEVELWASDIDWAYISYGKVMRRTEDSKGRLTKALPVPLASLKQEKWGTIICDEAHYLKNRKANSTLAIEKLVADQLFQLTGTPVPNWGHEIYMLVRLLNIGVDTNSYWRWIHRWFKTWKPPWGGTEIRGLKPGITWERFIRGNNLDSHMMRRSRDDVLTELPPIHIAPPTLVDMTPEQRRVYRELTDDFLAWAEDVHGTTHELIVWSKGGRHTKLHQATTGLETLDPDLRGSGKLDHLRELMIDRRHSPTLIACQYRNTATAVSALCRKLGIRTGTIRGGIKQSVIDDTRRSFQRREIEALVCTYDKASLGMTLTAADTIIRVERSWRPGVNDQFLRRAHRMGQTRPVNVITIETRDSTDQAQTKLLDAKTDETMEFLTAQELARALLDKRARV